MTTIDSTTIDSTTIDSTTIDSTIAPSRTSAAGLGPAGRDSAEPTCDGHPGPLDRSSVQEALAALPAAPGWEHLDPGSTGARRLRGAERILRWLIDTDTGGDSRGGGAAQGAGRQGWQQRWMVTGADGDPDWWKRLLPADGQAGRVGARGQTLIRKELSAGFCWLAVAGVLRPSYELFGASRAGRLLAVGRRSMGPELLARFATVAEAEKISAEETNRAQICLAKIVLHVGRPVEALRTEDLLELHRWGQLQWAGTRRSVTGLHTAWRLLVAVGILDTDRSLLAMTRDGQRPIPELVDRYGIACTEVRDVLVRYLSERAPALDYNTLRGLVGHLAGRFWADIERHHPGIDSLHLPDEVVIAWKQRLQRIGTGGPGSPRRKTWFDVLLRVRAFYLDIQEWALTDPSWAPWAVPSPVKRRDTEGFIKARAANSAQMHQRIRDRLPHLPLLVRVAGEHLDTQRALLAAASAVEPGERFVHDGRHYLRHRHRDLMPSEINAGGDLSRSVLVHTLHTGPDLEEATDGIGESGQRIDLRRAEDDAFWSWASIETLRHTGVRLEELLEITHLALVSYRLPDTGEVVPLLQIVPSKSGQERLLLVSPELAAVLAAIISRLRNDNHGTVPLVSRYDPHERTDGPLLPHLFQRRIGGRRAVIAYSAIRRLLDDTAARAGLRDAAGQRLNYTAHDFRRMFATEAVTGGLPIHIAARILGHQSVNTTQAYVGVFQDDLVRAYRSFLDHRRALRPTDEYREPTDAEWQEFQQHFELRKLELGTCGRPYGSPCQHEHACVRCPMLRVDPGQRGRLLEIIANLRDRITEAKANGWLGEVQGLQTSLDAAARKLTGLDRSLATQRLAQQTDLGIPHPPAREKT